MGDDIDGEMGVSEDHSEFEADGDTTNHVSDSAADGSQSGVSFLLLKPHSELDSFKTILLEFLFLDLKRNMSEAFGDLAQGTGNGDNSSFDVNGNPLRNGHLLFGDDVLHGSILCGYN